VCSSRNSVHAHNNEYNVTERGAACKFLKIDDNKFCVSGRTIDGTDTYIIVEIVDTLNYRLLDRDYERAGLLGEYIGENGLTSVKGIETRNKIQPGSIINSRQYIGYTKRPRISFSLIEKHFGTEILR
jgi:hypothetical protein